MTCKRCAFFYRITEESGVCTNPRGKNLADFVGQDSSCIGFTKIVGEKKEKEFSMNKEKTLRTCRVNDENAYFHRWTQISQVIPPSNLIGGHSGGQLSEPFGIVEFMDGKVELVSPHKIQFTDNP